MRQAPPWPISTTLYDVISTLHTYVGVEDDHVIGAIVAHLLRTGQITCHWEWPTDHDWIETHDEEGLHDSSAVFPSQVECQMASSIDPRE